MGRDPTAGLFQKTIYPSNCANSNCAIALKLNFVYHVNYSFILFTDIVIKKYFKKKCKLLQKGRRQWFPSNNRLGDFSACTCNVIHIKIKMRLIFFCYEDDTDQGWIQDSDLSTLRAPAPYVTKFCDTVKIMKI